VQRGLDWISGLNLAQKVLAVLFAALLLFSASYLITAAILLLAGVGDQPDSSPQEGAASQSMSPGSASPELTVPDFSVEITSARWEGEKGVVEGKWKGDLHLSSVRCDLLEGKESARPTDWWDRSVEPDISFSERTFSQQFVEAEGTKIEKPLDPESRYWVFCLGRFSDGWLTAGRAPVTGTPPS